MFALTPYESNVAAYAYAVLRIVHVHCISHWLCSGKTGMVSIHHVDLSILCTSAVLLVQYM